MVALGLPKLADSSKPNGADPTSRPAEAAAKAAKGAAKTAEGKAQKFSMGVTLPTVPARLVKRILAGGICGHVGVVPGRPLGGVLKVHRRGRETFEGKAILTSCRLGCLGGQLCPVRRGGESLLSGEGCGSMGAPGHCDVLPE